MTAEQLPLVGDTEAQGEKVLIARAELIKHGRRLRAGGRRQAGEACLTACVGAGDWVPVSRALVELWGLGDGAE